jgi:hypothetical protein
MPALFKAASDRFAGVGFHLPILAIRRYGASEAAVQSIGLTFKVELWVAV